MRAPRRPSRDKRCRVVLARATARRCRRGIIRILTDDHLKDRDGIGERPSHRAGNVGQQVERHHARPTRQAHRRTNSCQCLVRGGATDRVARIGAEPDRAKACRDRRGRAAARARGDTIEGIGVLGVARQDRAQGFVGRKGPLGHVRLGQDDGAGFFDASDLKGVLRGDEPGQCERAVRALQTDGLEVILHDHRDAVERPREAALFGPGIELVGLRQCLGIGEDDCVDAGAVLVERVDAAVILFDQSAARHAPGLERRVDVSNAGFLDAKRRGVCDVIAARAEEQNGEKGCPSHVGNSTLRWGAVKTTLVMLAAVAGGVAQVARFEPVQKDLFAAGASFVNAWADFDGDGDPDLFVGFDGMPNRLYRNDKGTFADAAGTAGVADARPTRAASWGDADADGDPDLLVGFASRTGRFVSPAVLSQRAVESSPTPRSQRVSRSRPEPFVSPSGSISTAIGDLDLFVAFRDKPNALFRNDSGKFIDIAPEVGLADSRRTVGAVWFDYDEDGDLDVITGNMDGDANGLFSYTDGRFTDVAEAVGVAWGGRTPNDKTNGTVRPCVADVNNDRHLDLFFANYGKNGLFLNRGKGKFEDVSATWGIDIDARYDTCAFGDMDNDGNLDFYVNGTVTGGQSYPDYLFRNTGKTFEDVTPAEIGSPAGDHGAQWADYDADGDLDLALTGVQKDAMHWLLRNTLLTAATATASRAFFIRVVDEAGRSTLAGR